MKFISAMKAERCVTQLLAEPDSNTPLAQKALQSLKDSGPGAIPIMIDAYFAGANFVINDKAVGDANSSPMV